MKVAVVGCLHGSLDTIYTTISNTDEQEGSKTSLVICCGDFQAVRDDIDLNNMACPRKYLAYGDFKEYYNGTKTAPILTLVVGGNHEATNHLFENYFGGWLCPNIYYLGHSGVVNFGGLRIAGISGIYQSYDFNKGYYEKSPYDEKQKRSSYHTREFEVFKLLQCTSPIDIFVSHEWPRSIMRFGNLQQLLRRKSYFQNEVDTIGSPSLMQLLCALKPKFWFSAHMHCFYNATFTVLFDFYGEKEHRRQHQQNHLHSDGSQTAFFALDKPLPHRVFLKKFEFDAKGELELKYDPEWLRIVFTTMHLFSNSSFVKMPTIGGAERFDFRPSQQEVRQIAEKGSLKVPVLETDFFKARIPRKDDNRQKEAFINFLNTVNKIEPVQLTKQENTEEIALDLDDDDDDDENENGGENGNENNIKEEKKEDDNKNEDDGIDMTHIQQEEQKEEQKENDVNKNELSNTTELIPDSFHSDKETTNNKVASVENIKVSQDEQNNEHLKRKEPDTTSESLDVNDTPKQQKLQQPL